MRLAVIGTFWRRPWAIPAIAAALRAQTRPPDECWLVYEDPADGDALRAEVWPGEAHVVHVPQERGDDGRMLRCAPSVAINAALDQTTAEGIVYLTDDSLPHPDKLARMAEALTDVGAVFCSQEYGRVDTVGDWLAHPAGQAVRWASGLELKPFCVVDHTQVAHRASDDRWPEDRSALPYADGLFFDKLVARFGPLHPVPDVLDWTMQLPDGISAAGR